jgi:hypothetical protein
MFYIWSIAAASTALVVLLWVIVYLAIVKEEIFIKVRFWPPSVEIVGRGSR